MSAAGAGWVCRIASLMALGLMSAVTLAQDDALQAEEQTLGVFNEQLDRVQTQLNWTSRQVDILAHYIDDFFAEDEPVSEGRSRLALNIDFSQSRYQNFDSNIGFDLRVALPKIEHKLNVYIESNSEPNEVKQQSSSLEQSRGEQDNRAGLRAIYYLTDTLDLKLRTGLRFNQISPNPFFGSSMHVIFPLTDKLNIDMEPEWLWYRFEGIVTKARLNTYYRYSDHQYFRAQSRLVNYAEKPNISLSQTLAWHQRRDAYNTLSYTLGRNWSYEDHINSVQDTYFEVSWRNLLYDKWLFLTVTPGVSGPKGFNYRPNPYVVVSFKAYSVRQ